MNPYLQRLYDASGGTAAAVEARPAQRSSSPLLALDQRLASPTYAASFLLGLPGAGDPDAAPPPEPDLLTFPEPGRRDPTPAPGEATVHVPEPRPVRPATPEPEAENRGGPLPSPEPPRDQVIRPVVAPRDPAAESTPIALAPAPTVEPTPPRVDLRTQPIVESARRADPGPPSPAEPKPLPRVVEPAGPAEPGHLRARPDQPPRTAPERARRDDVSPPPLVRPVPKPADEPLPPPRAPRASESSDLADQVRRLVREAIAGNDAPRRTSRDQHEDAVADPVTTASQARSAEAMSVIGPLDRSARATTLYGLRLR